VPDDSDVLGEEFADGFGAADEEGHVARGDAARENFAVAMDRLAEAWREVEDRYGFPFESPDIAARAVMGMALLLALESHHSKNFDRDRAVGLIGEGNRAGVLPAIEPERRRR